MEPLGREVVCGGVGCSAGSSGLTEHNTHYLEVLEVLAAGGARVTAGQGRSKGGTTPREDGQVDEETNQGIIIYSVEERLLSPLFSSSLLLPALLPSLRGEKEDVLMTTGPAV
jgi:hypothetical protein